MVMEPVRYAAFVEQMIALLNAHYLSFFIFFIHLQLCVIEITKTDRANHVILRTLVILLVHAFQHFCKVDVKLRSLVRIEQLNHELIDLGFTQIPNS